MDDLFGEDMHRMRVRSIADGTLGGLQACELAIHAIGRGLAAVRGLVDKHVIKQVDRQLGNEGIDLELLMARWLTRAVRG